MRAAFHVPLSLHGLKSAIFLVGMSVHSRKRQDSNLRDPLGSDRFQDGRHKPLAHASMFSSASFGRHIAYGDRWSPLFPSPDYSSRPPWDGLRRPEGDMRPCEQRSTTPCQSSSFPLGYRTRPVGSRDRPTAPIRRSTVLSQAHRTVLRSVRSWDSMSTRRKRQDSNLRDPCGSICLANRRLRPLGHASMMMVTSHVTVYKRVTAAGDDP